MNNFINNSKTEEEAKQTKPHIILLYLSIYKWNERSDKENGKKEWNEGENNLTNKTHG